MLLEEKGSKNIFLEVFIYYLSERECEHRQGVWQAEGEIGSPLRREPDMGLDPRTLRS